MTKMGDVAQALIRFFDLILATGNGSYRPSLTVRTNVQKLGQFTPAAWSALASRINALAAVKTNGLQIAPGDLSRYATIGGILKALKPEKNDLKPTIVRKTLVRPNAPMAPPGKTKSRFKPIGPGVRTATKKAALGRGAKTSARPKPGSSPRAPVTITVDDSLPTFEKVDVAPAATREPSDRQYVVRYGTNRKPNDSSDPSKGYSGQRDTKIHFGECTIFVPKSHKIGSTGSSTWSRFWSGEDDRLKLTGISESSADEFWSGLSQHLESLAIGERDAVVFVHGYNNSFEDAAIRAAQIGVDLGVKGAMAFFSWPSQGALGKYSYDEAAVEASEPYITNFLIDFAARSGADKVHLIVHSMGNRGVLRAADRIAANAAAISKTPFEQIILAAADVDADTFRNLATAYAKVSRRTTMYVSSRDRAIEAAQWLHGFDRAGYVPPVFVTKGIDTINVTNIDMTLLGHGYVADARGVLTDMHDLIANGSPPSQRFGLRAETDATGETYWVIGA